MTNTHRSATSGINPRRASMQNRTQPAVRKHASQSDSLVHLSTLSEVALQPLEFLPGDFATCIAMLGHVQRAFTRGFVTAVVTGDTRGGAKLDPAEISRARGGMMTDRRVGHASLSGAHRWFAEAGVAPAPRSLIENLVLRQKLAVCIRQPRRLRLRREDRRFWSVAVAPAARSARDCHPLAPLGPQPLLDMEKLTARSRASLDQH